MYMRMCMYMHTFMESWVLLQPQPLPESQSKPQSRPWPQPSSTHAAIMNVHTQLLPLNQTLTPKP